VSPDVTGWNKWTSGTAIVAARRSHAKPLDAVDLVTAFTLPVRKETIADISFSICDAASDHPAERRRRLFITDIGFGVGRCPIVE
jgi:hypothetical protein